MTGPEFLELHFYCEDLHREVTVRDYLRALLAKLWREEAGFSGKRPYGNSNWQYDVYEVMIRAGVLDGEFDEDGFIKDFDEKEAERFMLEEVIGNL